MQMKFSADKHRIMSLEAKKKKERRERQRKLLNKRVKERLAKKRGSRRTKGEKEEREKAHHIPLVCRDRKKGQGRKLAFAECLPWASVSPITFLSH